jgi:hypothetical protein
MAPATAGAVFLGLGLRLRAQEGQWPVQQHRPSFFGLVLRPTLGQLLSVIMSDGSASVDNSPLRPSRFQEGELNPCPEML